MALWVGIYATLTFYEFTNGEGSVKDKEIMYDVPIIIETMIHMKHWFVWIVFIAFAFIVSYMAGY